MGKKWLALWMAAALMLLCGTALAQTLGITVDGKEYAVTGGVTQFEADGKTFIIGEETVTVREPGKADQILPICTLSNDRTAVQSFVSSSYYISSEKESVWIEQDTTLSADICQESVFIGLSDKQKYSLYTKYGLSYDEKEKKLYYCGMPVRVFTDAYQEDGYLFTMAEYFNASGTVDVEAVREKTDASACLTIGELVGLRQLTEAEFKARDLSFLTSGSEVSCESAE